MHTFSLRFGDAVVYLNQHATAYTVTFNDPNLQGVVGVGKIKAYLVTTDPDDTKNHFMALVSQLPPEDLNDKPVHRLKAHLWFSTPARVVCASAEVTLSEDLGDRMIDVVLNNETDGLDVYLISDQTTGENRRILETIKLG